MTPKQLESVTKAAQCADLLVTDLREAHTIACDGEPALEILLMDALADARKLKDRMTLIEGAVGVKPGKPMKKR